MQNSNASRYAARMNKVIAHIRQHTDDAMDVASLSEVAHFSAFHFHRQFTSYTGLGVHRFVQLLRLQRASMQLAFNPGRSITDIAFDAGYASMEAFTRAFRKQQGQSPSAFRKNPEWQAWQVGAIINALKEYHMKDMQPVEIIDFPSTLIAALEHHGPEQYVYNTTKTFIEWRRANGVSPDRGDTYGIHYSDPHTTRPEDYRLDIGVSVDAPVAENPQGVVTKLIPGGRCARIRHLGSRQNVFSAEYLYREWLPVSGEELRDFPIFFHYVNVGPEVKDEEMITDVYLPLKSA